MERIRENLREVCGGLAFGADDNTGACGSWPNAAEAKKLGVSVLSWYPTVENPFFFLVSIIFRLDFCFDLGCFVKIFGRESEWIFIGTV
jgi:hypothetical protein